MSPPPKPTYETISITEALALAEEHGKKVSTPTIINWIDSHIPKLGHQPGGNGGKWFVFKDAFEAFISGEEALCNELLEKIAKGE
jgi:hypothetical protein